jgi:hypothetical protein
MVGVPILFDQPVGAPEISAFAPFDNARAPAQPLETVAASVSLDETPAQPKLKGQEVVVPLDSAPALLTAGAKIAKKAAAQAAPIYAGPSTVVAPPHRVYAWRKHREVSAFQRYWQEVASSFIRDWRHFFRSLVPQAATVPGIPSFRTDSIRRKVVETIRGWLAKPLNLRATPRAKSDPVSSDGNTRRN